jgi:methionine-rich copper-binding protein CopC
LKKLFALALALLVVLPVAPAFAHAELNSASPKANVKLIKAPTQIKLTFDDDLVELPDANKIQVTNSKRMRVDLNNYKVLGNQITVGLKKLVVGSYRVTYRVLSADGHPITASYSFSVVKK